MLASALVLHAPMAFFSCLCRYVLLTCTTQFTGMELFDAAGNSITPVWDAIEGQELACGEKADVLSPDAVNIDFQKSE